MKEDIADSELQRDVLDELKCDPGVNVAHVMVQPLSRNLSDIDLLVT